MQRDTENTSLDLNTQLFPSSLLQNITNTVPVLVAVYELKTGKYIYVNKAIKKLLGYTQKDFLEKGLPFVVSLVHPDDLGRIQQENVRALEKANSSQKKSDTEPIAHFEYRMQHKNGEWRWFQTDGSIFSRDKKGKVSVVLNASMDITTRKEAEEKLRELTYDLEKRVEERTTALKASEERYRSFLSQSSEGIWRFELEKPLSPKLSVKAQLKHMFRYAYLAECNEVVAKMYGYKKPEDIVGARLPDFLVPTDPENIAYLTAFIKSGYRLTDAESREKDRFGKTLYFSNNLVGILENGLINRAWGTQRDITLQRKMEEEMKTNEERLRLAVEAGKIGIWDWNIESNTILWSNRVYEIHGLKKEEFSGKMKDYVKLIYPADRKFVQAEIKKALQRKKSYQLEFRAYGPDKSILWISTSAQILFSSEGKPLRMLGAVLDITERKKMEERKDDFIALASHELKTPVTSLKIFAQLLQRNYSTKKELIGHELEGMDKQISKLADLVSNLLDLSRLQEGKLKYQKESFILEELVQEIVESVQRVSPTHQIEFSSNTRHHIFGDRQRIGQVLTNILNNAVKYSPQRKEVQVSLHKKGQKVVVQIEDFGIGISPHERERIFERFFQAGNPTKQTFPGLGLGLYISKEIIERHQGKIWVEGKEKEGSIFSVQLPLEKKK